MQIVPDSLKVIFNDQPVVLKPFPLTFSELLQSTGKQISSFPSDPIFSYLDSSGDKVRVWNTRSLSCFYSDLQIDGSLYLELTASFEEVLQKKGSTLKSTEEDIINLTLLGIVYVDKEVLQSIKYVQTDFSKKIIAEVLALVKQTSIEEVAERFQVPWEVIFFFTQQNNMNKKSPYKTITYTKVKNIIRPCQMNEAVQEFLTGKSDKNQLTKKFDIDLNIFELWLNTFKNPKPRPAKISHLQNKEKMKLVSSYLTAKVSLDELRFDYNVSEEQIVSWAVLLSKEEKVYERERIISAEEKYDVLDRYFKGTYTVDQFQSDYGIGVNLFYRWVRQVQSGKPLTSSNIFRTASDELEAAYNIFLQTMRR
jgi:hypothetical protein